MSTSSAISTPRPNHTEASAASAANAANAANAASAAAAITASAEQASAGSQAAKMNNILLPKLALNKQTSSGSSAVAKEKANDKIKPEGSRCVGKENDERAGEAHVMRLLKQANTLRKPRIFERDIRSVENFEDAGKKWRLKKLVAKLLAESQGIASYDPN